jgi:serine/threonine protein kinase
MGADPAAEALSRPTSGEKTLLKLGRYEIVRELGKGAMGVVYLAKDPLIGRLVALKTIRASAHAEDDETKEFQERFVREAQAAGILNHPSIVTVHDIGQDDTSGTSFIAMEYVEGNNLKEVLAQGRTLSFEQAGDIIVQIADALDFAHTKGIVHRDVKPANIILLEGNRAKITDFGIAKIASGASNLTSTGQFLGTPNYMAPEQIKGAPVDGRTDIFALGICLYECLTRRKPFGGDSLTSISYKIVHENFPALHEINPQIPEGYEEVISNCLAKDPAKRYQRARDMANALRAVIRGERPVRPADPMLAEETVVTRSFDKQPTVEVPFPEALEASDPAVNVGGSTRPAASASGAIAAATGGVKAAKAPGVPLKQRVHRTLTNVRTSPAWKRRISPPVFIAIVAVLVAGLIGAVAAIRSKAPAPAVIDRNYEARVARQRQLREEGNALLRQGRVTDAHAKFEELSRLAPRSPFVASILDKLNAIRQQEELSKQQIAQAQAKFTEGVQLFNEKKYPEAILRFQESFSINPNAEQTVEYLKLAQIEQQRADEAARAARSARTTRTAAGATTTTSGGASTQTSGGSQSPAASPSQLTTVMAHPFVDGRIVVRAGGDVVANEALFDERPARFLRRASRTPRAISVTNSFPAKNADLQVWVSVPTQNISEHHTIPNVRFQSGGSHRLIVRYDAAAKKFSYELH